jgi:hypothetical protein
MLTYADKAVAFTLTLDVDLNLIDDHEAFKQDVINDVATAANVNGTQFTCFTSTSTKSTNTDRLAAVALRLRYLSVSAAKYMKIAALRAGSVIGTQFT